MKSKTSLKNFCINNFKKVKKEQRKKLINASSDKKRWSEKETTQTLSFVTDEFDSGLFLNNDKTCWKIEAEKSRKWSRTRAKNNKIQKVVKNKS